MNKFIYLLLFSSLLISFELSAQKETHYTIEESEIGKNRLTGATIMAKEYRFEERVHDFELDTLNDYITLQLRAIRNNGRYLKNKGYVVRYSINENRILWSKKLNYLVEHIEQFEGTTLLTSASNSYCLNNETGEKKWQSKTSIFYVFPKHEIAIGYSLIPFEAKSDMLKGIDLKTGSLVWKRKISREYGWNGIETLNDSTLIIAAAGLHSLNIKTGKGWDYDLITGKKDYTRAALTTAAGAAVGLLTGTFVVGTGHNLVRDVCSNIYLDSNYIYFASKEKLVKLNRNGSLIWEKDLTEGWSSKSLIYQEKDKLMMINRGYAKMGNRDIDFGDPYIAAFNPENGTKIYQNLIIKENEEYIKALKDLDDNLIFILNNKLINFEVASGNKVADTTLAEKEYGKADFFIGDYIYVKRDSNLMKMNSLDTNLNYLYTTYQKVIGVNEDLEVVESLNDEKYYLNYHQKNGLRFVGLNNNSYIINEAGEIIADLKVGKGSLIVNDKLYTQKANSIMQIDLSIFD